MKQSSRMLHQTDGLSLQSAISVLVFHLLLTHSCRGQSQLIGPPQSIVALVGDDVILPCHLKPEMDVTAEPLEWKRSDLNPELVHVMRDGRSLENAKHSSYRGRTSLFTDELKRGNMSLKLSNVQVSDQATYKCDIPLWNKESSVKLVVVPETVSSAVISLSGMDRDKGGVLLDCESRGWYPEPEVLWLDGEGNLLSAGPTETVRGPDDLYTVSSRVTVEKRHSNSFTCRVQQRTINQTRETHITVSDDFFKLQSSFVPIITGLAVSLAVCILFIVLLLFVVWRWRQNTVKNKRSSSDEAVEGGKQIRFKTNKSEDQLVTEDGEREQLMTDGTVPKQVVKDNGQKKSKHRSKQQQKEEAEKELQTLKEELETKKNEVETKQAELQKLHEEKKKNETELQNLKEELKNREEIMQRTQSRFSNPLMGLSQEDLMKEVETLKKTLETEQEELNTNIKKIEHIEAEVQQLQDQIQRMETNLPTLMEFKWPLVSRQNVQEEQQRRKEADHHVSHHVSRVSLVSLSCLSLSQLEGNLADTNIQLRLEKQRSHEAQKEVETLKNLLESKKQELEYTETQWKKSNEEMKRRNEELKKAKSQLKSKNDKIGRLKREWQKKLHKETTKRKKAERQVKTLKELITKVHC